MTFMPYDWEGSDDHKAVIMEAFRSEDDAHGAVAARFGIDRQEAKLANWRLAFGGVPYASPQPFAELVTVGGCLLSDMHHNLHRGEACPECGYKFEDIG